MASYKATLKANLNGLNITVPVKYERLTSKDVKDKIKIICKADDGEEIKKLFRYVDKGDITQDVTDKVEVFAQRKKVNFGESNGKIYTDDEVKDFQLVEDAKTGKIKEVEVAPPSETTKEFEVIGTRPMDSWDNYLAESEYELYSDDQKSLKDLADYMIAHDEIVMFEFQRARTHKPMIAFVKPVFEPNGFVLVMRLTMTKYSFKRLMDLTATAKQRATTNRAKVALNV